VLDLKKGKYWCKSLSGVKGCAPNGFGKGCPECWAARMAQTRLTGHPDYEGVSSDDTLTGWSGQVNLCDVHIPNGNPQVFALNWMGELFNPKVPFSHIDKMFAKMIYGGLPPASRDDAVKYLEESTALSPKVVEHHLELAKCYIAVKKNDAARKDNENGKHANEKRLA